MPDDLDVVLDGVAPRLRALRARRGLTLAELSEHTGISVSTLSRETLTSWSTGGG